MFDVLGLYPVNHEFDIFLFAVLCIYELHSELFMNGRPIVCSVNIFKDTVNSGFAVVAILVGHIICQKWVNIKVFNY